MIDDIERHKNSKNKSRGEVKLRKFRIWDTWNMVKWGSYSDPRLMHYNFPYSKCKDLVQWYFYKKGILWQRFLYAAYNSNNQMVGYVILKNIDFATLEAEMGISFDTNHINSGYGTSAVRQFLAESFNNIGMKRVWLKTAAFNGRAIRCYEKAGFRQYSRSIDKFEEQSYAYGIISNYSGFEIIGDDLYTEYVYMEVTKKDFLQNNI